MKKNDIYFVLAVLLTFFLSTALYGDQLSGTVKDNSSKSLVPGAVILIENTSFSDTTDASGNFLINDIPRGEYNIIILADNYQQKVYKKFMVDDSVNVSINDPDNRPMEFELKQNYPNPFNPTTRIAYTMNKGAHVRLTIYNNLGKRVKLLVDKWQTNGSYDVTWDAKNEQGILQSSGVYFYQLQTGKKMTTRRMVLIK